MTYVSLYHVDSLLSHFSHTMQHIHHALGPRLIQQVIQCNECARPSHTRTAVHDLRSILAFPVVAAELPMESQEGGGLRGNAVVRPRRKVKLADCCCETILTTTNTQTDRQIKRTVNAWLASAGDNCPAGTQMADTDRRTATDTLSDNKQCCKLTEKQTDVLTDR